jgi:hypothetical protein
MPRNSSQKSLPLKPHQKSLPLPAPKPYYPPQTSLTQSSGVWDSVKQGFGWGVGTSIARSLFTPSAPASTAPAPLAPAQNSQTSQTPKCQEFEKAFDVCVRGSPHDIQTCQEQLDVLNRCLSI